MLWLLCHHPVYVCSLSLCRIAGCLRVIHSSQIVVVRVPPFNTLLLYGLLASADSFLSGYEPKR